MVATVWASYEEEHGGTTYHETSKPVEIPIYKKYAIPIPHPVPVPVPQQIKVPIPQPYQVPVAVPHPVPVEVVKHVEIPIEKPEPYVVEKKVLLFFCILRTCKKFDGFLIIFLLLLNYKVLSSSNINNVQAYRGIIYSNLNYIF